MQILQMSVYQQQQKKKTKKNRNNCKYDVI